MENSILMPNERIDELELNNLKIIQKIDGFCFGIDSVLLSDFARKIKNNCKVLDLGTGTGILGILLCAKTNLKQITGIEIQKVIADMATRSIMLNNLQEKFDILICYRLDRISRNVSDFSTTLKNFKAMELTL